MPLFSRFAGVALMMLSSAAIVATPVAVESTEAGKQVLVDGKSFAEYRTDTGRQPAVWPIYGPSGDAMTRSWPLGPRRDHEEVDHPHHESLWFSHGGVNGHDFWVGGDSTDPDRPHIVHRKFLRCDAADGVAVIKTANDWNAEGETIITDTRELKFGVLGGGSEAPRYIDFQIRLIASEGPATFADTKEGTFGVRVPGTMKIDAKMGGEILNSHGQSDESAWGQPAAWVDYHGPLSAGSPSPATAGGIVMMSHPDSFRPECRWHVRTYGLFAANPFGAKEFPAGQPTQGEVKLQKGEDLTLSYRVVFYAGDVTAETIRGWYNAFAKK